MKRSITVSFKEPLPDTLTLLSKVSEISGLQLSSNQTITSYYAVANGEKREIDGLTVEIKSDVSKVFFDFLFNEVLNQIEIDFYGYRRAHYLVWVTIFACQELGGEYNEEVIGEIPDLAKRSWSKKAHYLPYFYKMKPFDKGVIW